MNSDVAKVWLKDVARAAGVSVAAASQAINRTGTLAEKTRERILAVAHELGYERDPILSGIASKRFRHGSASDYLPIAIVSLVASNQRLLSENEFPLALAREIGGVLFGSMEGTARFDSELWNAFSVLGIGDIPSFFPFNKVETDWGHSVRVCFGKLREAGCRRIGMVVVGGTELTYQDKVRLGAYLSESHTAEDAEPIPLFYDTPGDDRAEAAIFDWYRSHRPDGLIAWPLGAVFRLRKSGVAIPGEVKVALMKGNPLDAWYAGFSGMILNARRMTELRLRFFFDQLRHNERGKPENPVTHRIQLRWGTIGS